MTGYYINLERSAARRAAIEAQLATHALAGLFSRFPGVDGRAFADAGARLKPGEIGCFKSHLGALRSALGAGGGAHILEDDVILSPLVAPFRDAMAASGQFDRFDIIFTDTFLPPDLMQWRFFKQSFDRAIATRASGASDIRVLDISSHPFACASSYIVAPRALARVVGALDAQAAAGPELPIDLCFRALANRGELKVGCTFPFITSVRLEDIGDTTIEGRDEQVGNLSVLALALLRYAFFIDGDIEGYARRYLDRIPGPMPIASGDARLDLIVKITAFILSDRFETF